MFQDIYPNKFDNQFKNVIAAKGDRVIYFAKNEVCLKNEEIPSLGQFLADGFFIEEDKLTYAFSVNDERYYIYREFDAPRIEGPTWQMCGTKNLRGMTCKLTVFNALMGYHLFQWYEKNAYCGRCGQKTVLDEKERACTCPSCGNVIYPRISPVVIVGVTHGDEILLTKYADRDYARYALIAGFMEFGETPEDTVHREVYEEAGLKVKNIRYYRSQPWPYPDSLLMGFYAEVDGDTTPTLLDGELKEATWFKREDMPVAEADFALTSELMENFRLHGGK